MSKLNTQTEAEKQAVVITRFFTALVYVKNTHNSIETALRTLITTNVNSEDEALGYAIKYFDKEMIGYSLQNKCVTAIVGGNYTEVDMIESAKYGYDYHINTSFPDKNFEDNCRNNFLQHLLSK
jgi:hypothetical protein